MDNTLKLRDKNCEITAIYSKPIELFCHTECNRGCPKKTNRFNIDKTCFEE